MTVYGCSVRRTVEERTVASVMDLPLRDRRVVQMLDYWQSLREGTVLPQYCDVEPAAITPLLSNVWFWGYDEARECFLGRLAGEGILDIFGSRDMRGIALHDFAPKPVAARLHERFLRVIKGPLAVHYEGQAFLANGTTVDVERIVLPMHDRSKTCDMVMGLSIYAWPNRVRMTPGFVDEAGTMNWAPIA